MIPITYQWQTAEVAALFDRLRRPVRWMLRHPWQAAVRALRRLVRG